MKSRFPIGSQHGDNGDTVNLTVCETVAPDTASASSSSDDDDSRCAVAIRVIRSGV